MGDQYVIVENFQCLKKCDNGLVLNRTTNKCIRPINGEKVYYFIENGENILLSESECYASVKANGTWTMCKDSCGTG